MGHDRLANHFKTQFGMVQHHKWSMEELEAMMPWERYIYVEMLSEWLKEEEKKAQDRKNELRAQQQAAQRRKM
jgi:hypothetical protein